MVKKKEVNETDRPLFPPEEDYPLWVPAPTDFPFLRDWGLDSSGLLMTYEKLVGSSHGSGGLVGKLIGGFFIALCLAGGIYAFLVAAGVVP